MTRAEHRGFTITPETIGSRVSPDIYVEIIEPNGHVAVVKPSISGSTADPAPRLPVPLPVRPAPDVTRTTIANQPYQPDSAAQTIGSVGRNGPRYRMEATSLPGATLVVATRLDTVNATLNSLRTIEIVLSVGLLLVLLVLITVLIRYGLRPLEDMSTEADAIAAGDLTRRVHPTEGNSEVARLGRALNGMLTQIESAFAQRARSEDHLRSFLADASHELRTPLTSIQGYAELLRKDALADDASRDRALSRIEKEAARMGALLGDLAVLAREGEGPEPTRYRVDLAAVAAEAVSDARALDRTRRIELDAPREAPVAGDDARLAQMVHNLLRNALAHTPAGTPVEVQVAVRGDRVLLRVRDHGPGMSAEEADHAFDRFYRGDAGQRSGGSGLGLYIVERLARSFDGSVSIETEEGHGATFEVVLPRYGVATPSVSATTDASQRRISAERGVGEGQRDDRAQRERGGARPGQRLVLAPRPRFAGRGSSFARQPSRRLDRSAGDPVVEVGDPAREAVHAQQVEVGAEVFGERRCAASHRDRGDEQVHLVDHPGDQGLPREVRTPDREITSCGLLHPEHRLRVEGSLDPRPGTRGRVERLRVHDLVGTLPDRREVTGDGIALTDRVDGLPVAHGLVHPAPVQIGADAPLEIVDEGVHLFVRHRPVELAGVSAM